MIVLLALRLWNMRNPRNFFRNHHLSHLGRLTASAREHWLWVYYIMLPTILARFTSERFKRMWKWHRKSSNYSAMRLHFAWKRQVSYLDSWAFPDLKTLAELINWSRQLNTSLLIIEETTATGHADSVPNALSKACWCAWHKNWGTPSFCHGTGQSSPHKMASCSEGPSENSSVVYLYTLRNVQHASICCLFSAKFYLHGSLTY